LQLWPAHSYPFSCWQAMKQITSSNLYTSRDICLCGVGRIAHGYMYHLQNVSQEPSTTAFIKAIRMKPDSYESVANIYTVPRINLSSCASIPPSPSWLNFCSGVQLNVMS
jgi:hypothetical protein